ncbi:MAG: NYN domain-containing protein [Alphaproteobacteria bacterium]|nr:NYN domain-containing protein [Alphaproteobacteria bacterium]
MRTYVYIDDFTLYYGALKGTDYKWLDLSALMSNLLPRNNIIRVELFTARIKPRPSCSRRITVLD